MPSPPRDLPEVPEEAMEAAVNGHPEAWRETIEEAVERAAPAILAVERERLGMEECPNCDEGVVCGTDAERDPDGNLYPVPVQERCATCGGSNFMPAYVRTAIAAERSRSEKLAADFADRVQFLAPRSSAPTAWQAALQEFNLLYEESQAALNTKGEGNA